MARSRWKFCPGVLTTLLTLLASFVLPSTSLGEMGELDLTTLEYATELGKRRNLKLESRVTTERRPMAALRSESGVAGGPLDPRATIKADTPLYRRLGLIPWDEEPSEVEWPWLPGFYVAGKGRLIIAREARGPNEKAAHLIAVQLGLLDQGIGLSPLTLGDNGDHLLARQAFVLGDAALSWLSQEPQEHPDDVDARAAWAVERVLALVPAKQRGSDAFPDRLVRARLSAGVEGLVKLRNIVPWRSVDRFHATGKPVSTSQLLHAERLIQDHVPRTVEAGTIEALAGLGSPSSGVLGELRLRLWLETWLQPEVAARVTDGWTGDRYMIYPPTGSATPWTAALLLMTTWDIAGTDPTAEAIDFEGTLVEMVRARSKTALTQVEDAPTGTKAFLDTHEQATLIERREEKVLYLEGVAPELLTRIRDQAWESFRVGVPTSGISGPLAPPPAVAAEASIPPWYRRTPGLVALGLWLLVVLPLVGFAGTRLGDLNPVRIYVYGLVGTIAFILIGWALGL